jgi:hypothetical protein
MSSQFLNSAPLPTGKEQQYPLGDSQKRNIDSPVGFEIFTAVVLKSTIFWDMTLCSPLSFNRRFGGTYRLHLQGRRNKFSKKPVNKQVGGPCLLVGLLNLFLQP